MNLINIINKVLDSIKALHSIKMYHGDIHLKNILIDEDDQLKLIDFSHSGENNKKNILYNMEKCIKLVSIPLLNYIKKNRNILNKLVSNKNIMYNIDTLYFINSLNKNFNNKMLSFSKCIEILRWDEPKYTYETAVKPYLDIESL